MTEQRAETGPRYLRIVTALEAKLRAGQYRAGDQLPTEKQLAQAHRVALMTVRHALDELGRRGLVSREHGRGTFAAGPPVGPASDARAVMVVGPRHRPQLFLQDPYYAALLQGVEQYLNARHCDLILGMKHAQSYANLVRHKPEVRGILITGYQPYFKSELRELNRLAIPFVLMGRSTAEPGVAFVDADKEMAGKLATAWLLKQGCRRVGMIIHDRALVTDAQRLRGYHRALANGGRAFNKWLVQRVPQDAQSAAAQVQAFVGSRRQPDALVLSVVPDAAAAILAEFQKAARRGERPIPVAGFDDVYQVYRRCGLPCAIVESPLARVGFEAAAALLNYRKSRPVQRLLPVRLVIC